MRDESPRFTVLRKEKVRSSRNRERESPPAISPSANRNTANPPAVSLSPSPYPAARHRDTDKGLTLPRTTATPFSEDAAFSAASDPRTGADGSIPDSIVSGVPL